MFCNRLHKAHTPFTRFNCRYPYVFVAVVNFLKLHFLTSNCYHVEMLLSFLFFNPATLRASLICSISLQILVSFLFRLLTASNGCPFQSQYFIYIFWSFVLARTSPAGVTRAGGSGCFCQSDFKDGDFSVPLVIALGFCGNAFFRLIQCPFYF